MYIESIPNRDSPPAILVRESYREDGKVRKRTLANLSNWDPQRVEHFRVLLKGGVAVESAASVLSIERSLPHGHVAAVLGAARGSGSSVWFGSAPQDLQPVRQAMLVARRLEPAAKLATHRMLHDDTATSSLGRVLGVSQSSADDLYRALDWLREAQPGIERRLARQHRVGSTLVRYDLSSTWLTGRCGELAARGHSRDGKRDNPQIVFGPVCTAEGGPISVEVFKGNTADPATVAAQVSKLKERFGIERIAWAGDRGMLTSARIEQVLKPQGMDWVSSLRAPQIAPLRGEQAIALRVGRVIERFRMAKHLALTITDTSLSWTRRDEAIAAEAALDGLYVIRTSLPKEKLDANATVAAYKSLAHMERAFRSMKTVDLNVWPVFHYSAQRVRAHVFLCLLAYYVEWHMRQRLKPMLFDDESLDEASASRALPVAKAVRSEQAKAKDASKRAEDGLPVHSFRTLLKDLATLTYNIARTPANPNATIVVTARPTPIQAKAFELLGLNPACTQ